MERIQKLKRELDKRGLDAFLAIRNTRYLAGTAAGKAVIIPIESAPILICSRLELDQAKRESWIRDIRAFSSWKAPLRRGERVYFREPWQLVADCLRELGTRAIGHDGEKRGFMRKLRGVHAASYRELPEIVLELRKMKSKEEVVLLRKSAKIASRGMDCAAESIAAGRSELEIAAEVEYEMRRAGSGGTPFPVIVASGRNSWLPHATVTRKKLRRDELVVVDLGATFNGYASDMTRTFALAPTCKQLKLLQVVKRAQQAALAKVRAGVKAKTVDTAARTTIARAGYAKFFPHGSGHGVGLDVHELPSLAPTSKDILSKGMVLTIEPGIYIPNVGGARWEDMVLVTRGKYKLLTKLQKMLYLP
ncbi:MAG TPA: aminopeptidase P family protein [Hadesarchaea archaeon]|nr:aminopeptidase P family protein [Hadesarchaea archaeon]